LDQLAGAGVMVEGAADETWSASGSSPALASGVA
jgi:hypothetical protein